MKAGQYCIELYRGSWIIRRCLRIELCNNGTLHYVIVDAPGEAYYLNRTEALKRSFELNGWKWPPRPRTR